MKKTVLCVALFLASSALADPPPVLPEGVVPLPPLYECHNKCAPGLNCVDGCPADAVCTEVFGFVRYDTIITCRW